ncbi:MAG: hypothetical protein ACKVOU_14265 [Cytophagales bacterium]
MAFDSESTEDNWQELRQKLFPLVGRKPDLNAVLFLIGIQELGQGPKTYSKEEKQDLMHIATCKLLSQIGYFELESLDNEGWPHWKAVANVPYQPLRDQEQMLKEQAVEYFKDIIN